MDRFTYVRLASVSADLGDEQIDTERCVLIFQVLLDGLDLCIDDRSCRYEISRVIVGARPWARGRRVDVNPHVPEVKSARGVQLHFARVSLLTCARRTFGVYPCPPITPKPPAFVTAAASSGPAATFIPASIDHGHTSNIQR